MSGIFANLMQAFQGGSQQAAQPNNMPTPGNMPATEPPMNQGAQSGQVPNQQATQAPAPAPFADFKDFWQPPVVDPNNPAPHTGPVALNLDPAKLNETVGKVDFTKSLTPELMQKINAGGPEAMSAMLTAMNTIAQQTLAQSIGMNSKIAESAIAATHNNLGAAIPNMVREHTITTALRENNPMFSNPATQPLLDTFAKQAIAKHPHATPAQIQEFAKNYLTEFVRENAKHLGMDVSQGNGNSPGNQVQIGNTDFSSW